MGRRNPLLTESGKLCTGQEVAQLHLSYSPWRRSECDEIKHPPDEPTGEKGQHLGRTMRFTAICFVSNPLLISPRSSNVVIDGVYYLYTTILNYRHEAYNISPHYSKGKSAFHSFFYGRTIRLTAFRPDRSYEKTNTSRSNYSVANNLGITIHSLYLGGGF